MPISRSHLFPIENLENELSAYFSILDWFIGSPTVIFLFTAVDDISAGLLLASLLIENVCLIKTLRAVKLGH